jgi:excisionase family DNA binding protein
MESETRHVEGSRDPGRYRRVQRGAAALLDAFLVAFDTADESARREVASRLRPYLAEKPSQLLSAEQKAQQLGLHPDTLVRMARGGRIPSAAKVGREWRFPAGDCEILQPGTPVTVTPRAARPRHIATGRRSIAVIRGR